MPNAAPGARQKGDANLFARVLEQLEVLAGALVVHFAIAALLCCVSARAAEFIFGIALIFMLDGRRRHLLSEQSVIPQASY